MLLEEDLDHPEGIESFEDFSARVAWMFKTPYLSKFGAMWLDQLDDPGPEHAFLVAGWFSVGDSSVVAGASKSGKTFLALEIAMSIVFGRPVFGLPTRQGGVVYQCGEGQVGIKKRLRAWREHHGLPFVRETPFVLLRNRVDIYSSTEPVDSLIEEINAHAKTFSVPLALVIIDTLAKATLGAEEVSGRDMGMVLSNIDRIREKTGAHVMLVHHMNASGDRVRGHTSVYANLEQVILVSRDETSGVRTALLDKQKDGEDLAAMRFELMKIHLGYDDMNQEISSCVCIPVGEREAIVREENTKGLRMSAKAHVFMLAYFAADKRYGYPVPQDFPVPMTVRSLILWRDVKRVYGEMNPDDSMPEEAQTTEQTASAISRWKDTLKKRLQPIREELTAAGIMGFNGTDSRRYDTICWYTGKPLRDFPHTWKPASVAEPPPIIPETEF